MNETNAKRWLRKQIDKKDLAVEMLAKKTPDIGPWLRCRRAVTIEDGKSEKRERIEHQPSSIPSFLQVKPPDTQETRP